MQIVHFIQKFVHDEEGVTAIEYALIASLMAVAIIAGIGLITGGITTAFTAIAGALSPG